MAFSKSTRIIILLAIDTAFFLLELIVGYAVHSLALVADAFHMLNDVLSLCVGLWAVRVANNKTSSKMYTYGWQRAETLGALVNGVFLVALCVSIFLEAIQRFVDPPEINQPKLVLIVGCMGLASNILGLFLFHEHGHSHGGGHSHGHDEVADAEEGHAHSHAGHSHAQAADESGNVADVMPQQRIAGWPQTQPSPGQDSEATAVETHTKRYSKQRHSRSGSRYSGIEDFPVNPGAFRKSIIDASRMEPVESDEGTDTEQAVEGDDDHDTHTHTTPNEPLLGGSHNGYGAIKRKSIDHKQHNHAKPKESAGGHGGHGHSHGDLNMRGVFLHVMGDALGNIGVIGTALFIWLTDFSWRFYMDPAISLIITVIILASAIPLCKAASRILLQAVPHGISVDDITADIEDLPGIVSCHHVHVWQLSDTKLVASLHVQVEFDFKGEGSARYMELAQNVRRCLHEYGIHSSTIQPEFCLDPEHDHRSNDGAYDVERSQNASKAGSLREADACLLECGDACGGGKSCCPPASDAGQGGHDHAH